MLRAELYYESLLLLLFDILRGVPSYDILLDRLMLYVYELLVPRMLMLGIL